MARRSSREKVRQERTCLISIAGGAETVLPSGDREIAELVGVDLTDLTDLPFGVKSRMWMSRSRQIDDASPVNRAASHALKLAGLMITVRGPVVVHHEQIGSAPRLAASR